MKLLRLFVPALLLITAACGADSIAAPAPDGVYVVFDEGSEGDGGHQGSGD